MRRDSNTDFKVGLTVLAGIVALLLGIGWAKGWKFGLEYTLIGKFPTAAGIERGDPVYIAGIKRGVIGTIEARTNDVLIEMVLDKETPLHKDATASIMMLELMGGKKVEINPGTDGLLDPKKDTLTGFSTGDLSTLVATLGKLSDDLTSITYRGDTLLGTLNDLFRDERIRKGIPQTLDEARVALADMSRTMRSINSVIAQNQGSIRNITRQADELTSKLNATVDELRPEARTTLDSVRSFLTYTRGFLGKAEGIVTDLSSLVSQSRDKKGLLYKLTADDAFSQRIDSLVNELNKFVRQVRYQGLDANIRFFHSAEPEK